MEFEVDQPNFDDLCKNSDFHEDQPVVITKVDTSSTNIRPFHERVTSPYMTKFERARVIGTRALQLSLSAPPLCEVPAGMTDDLEIAERELELKRIPFIIRRYFPDKSYEEWPCKDLIIE
jgi:DNA-directed RNA polymerase I, II, and III subunit RPABC2